MTNLGNWTGSGVGKIILHLVKPLPIPVSRETDQKYTWLEKQQKTCLHAYSLTAGSPADSVSVQEFHTYPDTEGGPMAAVLLMVLSHQIPAFFHRWQGWMRAATIGDLETLQKHNFFPFIFTGPLSKDNSSELCTTQNPKAGQVDTLKPYSREDPT